ncbi:MAG: CYTH domain-containing protein [Patescibacteria group bacterium]|nr:CYTH domain-containing protein [Patescibacteria group bacterium]MDE2040770.1 CYTH domain-containing protein [Patescibacteria group bacterium]MDE2172927.1 CYTH domain-containing protein [Patescibacteria group bacterium]
MKHSYEVEIKTLLGSKKNAEKLKRDLSKRFPGIKMISAGRQLNHYFNLPADLEPLRRALADIIPADQRSRCEEIVTRGTKISLRSRQTDNQVLLVMKASVGDDTSSNGVKRMEFEVPVEKTLDELDTVLLDAGCTYQAKWSRERQEYAAEDMHVCIDRNAGYGYLAEFERVTEDQSRLDDIRRELANVMNVLGLSELPQDRLERMFAHYNSHWQEYYGTEKTFTIE